MKTLFTSALFLLFFAPVLRAQYVTIPDANFRAWLQNTYPACMGTGPNAGMLDTTCAEVVNETNVDFPTITISTLDGIQYFDNLESLWCDDLQLSVLPALPPLLVTFYCYDNLLQSLPTLPPTLEALDCSNNQLIALPNLPLGIYDLSCSQNQLTSLPSLPPSLEILSCASNQLSSLPALPSTLNNLSCGDNQLTSLPTLPNSLLTLNCAKNDIGSLPTLPNSLHNLTCFTNSLTSLPSLPAGLESLDCSDNQLSALPVLPQSLLGLSCGINQLTTLPTLPDTLIDLYCRNNLLTALPTLPSNLRYLRCDSNQLTVLPALPDSLEWLDCSFNQLDSLPTLPPVLNDLACAVNQISVLPALPNGITNLVCDYNQLTTLPALPLMLEYLRCNNNYLSELPELPSQLEMLIVSNNYDLHCLPLLPNNLEVLNVEYTGVTCIPNLVGLVWPPNLTVCNAWNDSNGCLALAYVEGNAFLDENTNGVQDIGELSAPSFVVQSQPGGRIASTNSLGMYTVGVEPIVSYTVTMPNPPPYHVLVPASHTGALPLINTFASGNHFAIQPIPNINDLEIDLTATCPPVPGFNRYVILRYKTPGTTSQNATVTLTHSDTIQYISAFPAPTTQTGNTLTWNVGTLAPWQTGYILVQCSTPANVALLGETLYSFASITPVANDTTPADNHAHLAEVVVGSYDPNDKQVLPEGDIPFGDGEWLTYTVRFQNTGTYPAQTVVIRDTLDSDLNIPTLTTVSASHNYVFELDGVNATWYFFNIQLPDSGADEPGSHGFVKYRIRARQDLALGAEVSNTAHIYFDFNPPIVTNTVVNTVAVVGLAEGISQNTTLRLYPNPSTGLVTVETPTPVHRIEVMDVTGRVVHTTSPLLGGAGVGSQQLNLDHLPVGLYTVVAHTANGRAAARLVLGQ